MKTVTHPPIVPMPGLDAWAQTLRHVAREPLELRPDFDQVARRFEAWWHREPTDRPILVLKHNPDPSRPIRKRANLLDDPDAWWDAKMRDVRQQRYIGEALPTVRVDFGPVMLGGLLGGRIEFTPDTAWTHPMIDDDWSGMPPGVIDEAQPMWRRFDELLDRASAEAPGRFLVAQPDLGGSADVLLNLRGSLNLCYDVADRPDVVEEAIESVYAAWWRAFSHQYDVAVGRHGAGTVPWLELWSDRPYVICACDFCCMIGPRDFERICLPDIARQAATVGRAAFHLDGPGAARHIDALLEVEHIQVIQFTPGEGTPSALAWVDMFRKILSRGRALYILVPEDEVLALRDSLGARGVAMVTDSRDPDALFEAFCR